MADKDQAITKFQELKSLYNELCGKNNSIMETVQKEVVKYQIEKYLNDNAIQYSLSNRGEYLLNNYIINQIDIDDYGFRVWSKENHNISPYIQYFHIEVNGYYIFGNMFEVKKNDIKSLDSISGLIYTYDIEQIININEKLSLSVENLKRNLNYISENKNPINYSSGYGEHNGAVSPVNTFENLEETMNYIHTQIKLRFKI